MYYINIFLFIYYYFINIWMCVNSTKFVCLRFEPFTAFKEMKNIYETYQL